MGGGKVWGEGEEMKKNFEDLKLVVSTVIIRKTIRERGGDWGLKKGVLLGGGGGQSLGVGKGDKKKFFAPFEVKGSV